MLTTTVTVLVLLAVLAGFAAIGLRARRGPSRGDVDDFTVARGSQGPLALGLSFLASGLGAWILFAPPELGAVMGVVPVVGYAVAAAGPFVVFALVGPRLRRLVPSGQGLTEFVRVRFGAAASAVVTGVSVLYMGVFLAAELVAIGSVVALVGGVPRPVTVAAVVVATLAYTTHGGLRASLRTDRWQGWLVVVLLATAAVAALRSVDGAAGAVRASGLLGVDGAGLESAVTLVLAVTAANLFHHGYWQRVWSARDEAALRRGAWIGAAATIPLMLVAGGLGVLAGAAGVGDVPALSVFALAARLPAGLVAVVLVLGVALVASSVDTVESGLAALVVAEHPRLGLAHARVLTVVVVLPAAVVGMVATSVLRLFLVADLLAAVLLLPVLLGAWRRTTATGVWTGVLAGVLGALGASLVSTGTVAGAVAAVTFPDAVPTLPPFAGAMIASGVTTLAVSVLTGTPTDLAGLDGLVQQRRAASVRPTGRS